MWWRRLGSGLVLVLSIIVPLTIKPSAVVLVLGWSLALLLLAGLLLTWPPVQRRLWAFVAHGVAEHLQSRAPEPREDTAAIEPARREAFVRSVHQVLDELSTINARVTHAQKIRYFVWNFDLPSAEWAANRDALATMTSTATRMRVANAYVLADQMNHSARGPSEDGREVTSDDDLAGLINIVAAARTALTDELPQPV